MMSVVLIFAQIIASQNVLAGSAPMVGTATTMQYHSKTTVFSSRYVALDALQRVASIFHFYFCVTMSGKTDILKCTQAMSCVLLYLSFIFLTVQSPSILEFSAVQELQQVESCTAIGK